MNRTFDATGVDIISNADGSADLEKHSSSKVAKHATPGRPDRNTGASKESSKTGRLNSEEAKNRDDQNNPEQNTQDVEQILDERGIQVATAQRSPQQAHGEANEPTSDDPKSNSSCDLEQKRNNNTCHERGNILGRSG